MPTLRAPVSGSRVTTQGSVMKRPPSSGQHCWMGRFSRVGGRGSNAAGVRQSGAGGHGVVRGGGASKWWMTSWQAPSLTRFGRAWRRSNAVPSNWRASLKLAGGLAFTRAPSAAAASSIEGAPRLSAMRRYEPSALMASGKGEICPLTVGFSTNRAWPPPGFFISRSASSVISSSLATGCVRRRSSPAASKCPRKSRNESNAMPGVYQTRRGGVNGNAGAPGGASPGPEAPRQTLAD